MAYDNPGTGNSGMGEDMHPGGDDMHEGMSGGGVLHISPDMLPKGMAETLKEGEILEFKVIGPADADGDVPVEYNTGKEEEGESWEDDFRKEMSPRAEQSEAM